MIWRPWLAWCVAVALFVGGCANPPSRVPPSSVTEKSAIDLHSWGLQARFAVHNHSDAWHGDLYWEQDHDRYLIELAGPLGQGKVRLRGGEGFAELTVSEHEVYTASDAQSLLFEHTGVVIPVEGLRHWMRGLSVPGGVLAEPQNDEFGRLARFKQLGWTVAFKHYAAVNGYLLPDKLFLNNQDYTLRLVVDQWRVQR